MTSTIDTTGDRALKASHRAMWALGDYPAVAIDVIPELGPSSSRRAGCARLRFGPHPFDEGAQEDGLGDAPASPATRATQPCPATARRARSTSTSRGCSRSSSRALGTVGDQRDAEHSRRDKPRRAGCGVDMLDPRGDGGDQREQFDSITGCPSAGTCRLLRSR